MPFFHHQQIDFYFEQSGHGPPVVFCHGLTADLPQMQELLGDVLGYSLVLWDARGHGRTEPLGAPEAFKFEQFAGDLHALLTHLGISQAVVGGVSMGAGVATRFALDWPEMVSGLMLVRPAWLNEPSPEPLSPGLLVGELLANYGVIEGRRRFEESPDYRRLRAIDPEAAQAFCDQFDKPRAAERYIRLQRVPASCPIRSWDEVTQLHMPALVIGCELDYVHPYSYAVEWSSRLRKVTLVKVPPKTADPSPHNAGVRQAMLDFLKSIEHRQRMQLPLQTP